MLDAVLNHRGSCVLRMIVTSRPCDHQVGLILQACGPILERRRLPITLAWVYQHSTVDVAKTKCYCRLGGGLPRAVRNVEAKRHSRRSVPSRLFPLSDMFVIPSAWDSRSGGGCNLPEIRSRMSLPNSRVLPCWCIAGLEREPGVLTRSLSRSEKTASARRDKLSHSFCRHNSSWPAPSSC